MLLVSFQTKEFVDALLGLVNKQDVTFEEDEICNLIAYRQNKCYEDEDYFYTFYRKDIQTNLSRVFRYLIGDYNTFNNYWRFDYERYMLILDIDETIDGYFKVPSNGMGNRSENCLPFTGKQLEMDCEVVFSRLPRGCLKGVYQLSSFTEDDYKWLSGYKVKSYWEYDFSLIGDAEFEIFCNHNFRDWDNPDDVRRSAEMSLVHQLPYFYPCKTVDNKVLLESILRSNKVEVM